MGVSIGKFYIGYRNNDPKLWKKYIFPKYYISPQYKHEYFKFYVRWLNFFFTMPRKCDCCGKYMDGSGGTTIWDMGGNTKLLTICSKCKDGKKFVDKDGREYTGYQAWLKEMWQ